MRRSGQQQIGTFCKSTHVVGLELAFWYNSIMISNVFCFLFCRVRSKNISNYGKSHCSYNSRILTPSPLKQKKSQEHFSYEWFGGDFCLTVQVRDFLWWSPRASVRSGSSLDGVGAGARELNCLRSTDRLVPRCNASSVPSEARSRLFVLSRLARQCSLR